MMKERTKKRTPPFLAVPVPADLSYQLYWRQSGSDELWKRYYQGPSF